MDSIAKMICVLWTASVLGAGCGGCGDGRGGPATGDGGDAADSGCPSGGEGTLEVVIEGLPAGVEANVHAGLGDGITPAVTFRATGSMTVPAGEYGLNGFSVADEQPIVRHAYGVPRSWFVCVPDSGSATVTVQYELIPSSNALWMSRSNGPSEILSYAQGDLGASGASAGSSAVGVMFPSVSGVAFDLDGNLWFASPSGTLARLPAAVLAGSGPVVPDIEITGEALRGGVPGPQYLAFDAGSNLWVGVTFSDKVLRYDADSLNETGGPTPAVELGGAGLGPTGIAFDADGNLWIAAADRVVRYDAARLDASSSTPPDRIIEALTPPPVISTLGSPSGLAFDEDGNLWVAYFGSNAIAKITPAELQGTGEVQITPSVMTSISVTALLNGIAFDESGGLWTPLDAGRFGRFSAAQLAVSGNVAPETIISGLEGYSETLAFFPGATGTPLYSALSWIP